MTMKLEDDFFDWFDADDETERCESLLRSTEAWVCVCERLVGHEGRCECACGKTWEDGQ